MADVEEEKPEPDLDELLELFREPEEEPRRSAIPGSVWLMLAMVLAMAGVWLAIRTATGPVAEKSGGPPVLPTKASDRKPREEVSIDVLEDYIARCKKGMTAREVRWVVEDFQKAELYLTYDGTSQIGSMLDRAYAPAEGKELPALPSDFRAQFEKLLKGIGRRQRAWYAESLGDGLHLDRQQKSMLKERLNQLLEQDFSKFTASWDDYEKETGIPGALPFYVMGLPSFLGDVAEPSTWLSKDEYAPWALCGLTEEQLAITHHEEVMQERSGTEPSEDENPPASRSWLDRRPSVSVVGTLEQSDDVSSGPRFNEAGWVFSFRPELQFSGSEGDLLQVAKKLHPAQLKMLLLLAPRTVDDLSKLLDQGNE